jgi:hypothetical protein
MQEPIIQARTVPGERPVGHGRCGGGPGRPESRSNILVTGHLANSAFLNGRSPAFLGLAWPGTARLRAAAGGLDMRKRFSLAR